jgi:hypothetical protein
MNSKAKTSIWMWVIGIFIAAVYFGPSIMGPVRNAILMRRAPAAGTADQAATKQPPAPPAVPGTATDPATVALFNRYEGIWRGSIAIPGRGSCFMRFELHPMPAKPGDYTGYSSLTCTPTVLEMLANKNMTPAAGVSAMTSRMNPTSAILSGSLNNGTIEYRVQKNLGVAQVQGGCAMSSLTAYPVGVQLAIDWKEEAGGACKGGQMTLARSSS